MDEVKITEWDTSSSLRPVLSLCLHNTIVWNCGFLGRLCDYTPLVFRTAFLHNQIDSASNVEGLQLISRIEMKWKQHQLFKTGECAWSNNTEGNILKESDHLKTQMTQHQGCQRHVLLTGQIDAATKTWASKKKKCFMIDWQEVLVS